MINVVQLLEKIGKSMLSSEDSSQCSFKTLIICHGIVMMTNYCNLLTLT